MPIDFPYTRLHVYQAACHFVVAVDDITARLPRGRAYLADQLRRAALSIQANIAEGAGEFSPTEKTRFYRMALRSATECGSLLEACANVKISDGEAVAGAVGLLDRIVAMLTRLVKRFA